MLFLLYCYWAFAIFFFLWGKVTVFRLQNEINVSKDQLIVFWYINHCPFSDLLGIYVQNFILRMVVTEIKP